MIKFERFQTLSLESLFFSKLMLRWMFPINIVSVFFSKVKLLFLNHCAQVGLLDSGFFSIKNDDFYFKSKKKFPDGTVLKTWLIFRVCTTPALKSSILFWTERMGRIRLIPAHTIIFGFSYLSTYLYYPETTNSQSKVRARLSTKFPVGRMTRFFDYLCPVQCVNLQGRRGGRKSGGGGK